MSEAEKPGSKKISRAVFFKWTGVLTALLATTFIPRRARSIEASSVGIAGEAVPGKSPDLVVLNRKPWNAETPAHLLDPPVTPRDLLFVRNNGVPPTKVDPNSWTLTIEGESAASTKTYTLQDLKSKLKTFSMLQAGF